MFLNAKTKKAKTFLLDKEASGTTLPQPLPPGLPYVANFTTFDDLVDRNILAVDPNDRVYLTQQDVRILYEAKSIDQNLKPTWEREVRFMGVLSSSCKGQVMCLKENGLGRTSAEAVAHVLMHNTRYSVLDVSGNRLRDGGAIALAQLLEANEDLVHISLSSNDIGFEGGIALARALEKNCTIVSIDLGGMSGVNRNHLGSKGAGALGVMLSKNRVLHTLNLGSNGIGAEGVALLSEGLLKNNTLAVLDLSSNNIGPKGCEVLASVLDQTALQELKLERNEIGSFGALKLAEALTSPQIVQHTLTTLLLEGNNIGDDGIVALGHVVKSGVLRHLNLNNNPLASGVTATGFASDLKENGTLEELYMSDCKLQDKELAALVTAVQNHKKLRKLDVSFNLCGSLAAKAIADMLKVNKKVRFLNLSTVSLGTEGSGLIVAALKSNATLQELNLRHNGISAEGGRLIAQEIRSCRSIQKLNVEYNDLTYKSLVSIQAVLDANVAQWEADAVPRLTTEIEQLDLKQKELYLTQEEMDNERRQAKEKTDHLLRRKEEGRHNADKFAREKEALLDKLAEAEGSCRDCQEALYAEQESQYTKRQSMDQRIAQLNRRTDLERDKRERLLRDTEKLRKQLRAALESEAGDLRPFQDELDKIDFERDSNRSDAKYQSEILATSMLKIKDLEVRLGISSSPEKSVAGAGSSMNKPPSSPAGGSGAKAAKQQRKSK